VLWGREKSKNFAVDRKSAKISTALRAGRHEERELGEGGNLRKRGGRVSGSRNTRHASQGYGRKDRQFDSHQEGGGGGGCVLK